MSLALVFKGRICKTGKYYGIMIPMDVYRKHKDIIERLHGKEVIVHVYCV